MAETILKKTGFKTNKETAIENQIKGAKRLKEGLKKGTSVYEKELSVERECEDFLKTNEVFISRMLGDNAHHAICQSENPHDRQNQLRKYIEHEIDWRIKIMTRYLKKSRDIVFDWVNIIIMAYLLLAGGVIGYFIKKETLLDVRVIVAGVFALIMTFLRINFLAEEKKKRVALVFMILASIIGGTTGFIITRPNHEIQSIAKGADEGTNQSAGINNSPRGSIYQASRDIVILNINKSNNKDVPKEIIHSRTLSETLTSEIRGCVVSVVNHNKGLEPLEGAKITIVGHKKSVFSDSLGNFSLGLNDVPTDSQVELQVEKEGFEPQKRNIVPNRTTEPIYIELKPIL